MIQVKAGISASYSELQSMFMHYRYIFFFFLQILLRVKRVYKFLSLMMVVIYIYIHIYYTTQNYELLLLFLVQTTLKCNENFSGRQPRKDVKVFRNFGN